MPVVMVERVRPGVGEVLYVSLKELCDVFPTLERKLSEEERFLELFIIEVRDERGKLVKRFKPMKKLKVRLRPYYDSTIKGPRALKYRPSIRFSVEEASKLNLGKGYYVSMVITRYHGNPVFPFEIKPLGSEAEKVASSLSRIERKLLLVVVEDEVLNEALSYLYDSYMRLDENDVEGARTEVRKSLQILKEKFIPNLIVEEETKDFKKKMGGLISKLSSLVSYGGPHPGPAPRTTTEMVIEITTDIITYLAKYLP